jgi:hypothetical protein
MHHVGYKILFYVSRAGQSNQPAAQVTKQSNTICRHVYNVQCFDIIHFLLGFRR